MINIFTIDPVLLLVGTFYILAGLSLWARPQAWLDMLDVIRRHEAAALICGMLALLVGLLITLFYQSWTTPGRVLLSVVGYIGIVEGMLFLLAPQLMQRFLGGDFYQTLLKFGGAISIGFGVLFLVL